MHRVPLPWQGHPLARRELPQYSYQPPGSLPPEYQTQSATPHTHGLRRLSHHIYKQAGHPEGNLDVLRWYAL